MGKTIQHNLKLWSLILHLQNVTIGSILFTVETDSSYDLSVDFKRHTLAIGVYYYFNQYLSTWTTYRDTK